MARADYANARVRARRGRLLGPKGITKLLAQPGLAARLEHLKQTDYGPQLATHLAREPDPLRAAERGLRMQLVEDLLAIDRFLDGERARGLFRSVLAFEDGWNLKTVLRGITRGEPPERTFLLLAPTPELDEAALGELVRQRDVKAVLDLLTTWRSPYASSLGRAFESFRTHRELFLLEVALDQHLFAGALRAARGDGEDGRMLLGFLEAQIDLANASTLLKRTDGARSAELFIPGGRLVSLKRFQKLATLRDGELREALARLGRLHLDLRLAAMGERTDPFAADQLLQRALRQAMRREAGVHPLSLAVPLSFVLERRAEVQRIRLVLRGAEFGVPGEELLALVER
jgi:V/A-type H+-transporting ATPase subunit C